MLLGGGGRADFPWGHHRPHGGADVITLWWGGSFQLFTWPSLTPHWQDGWGASSQSARVEFRFFILPSLRWPVWGEAHLFSVMFVWSRAVIVWESSYPFLARERRLSLGLLHVRVHWHFWATGFFSSQSGIYGNPENSPSCHSLGPKYLTCLPSSFRRHLSEFSLFCTSCLWFLVVLGGRKRKKYVCSIFPETKIPASFNELPSCWNWPQWALLFAVKNPDCPFEKDRATEELSPEAGIPVSSTGFQNWQLPVLRMSGFLLFYPNCTACLLNTKTPFSHYFFFSSLIF